MAYQSELRNTSSQPVNTTRCYNKYQACPATELAKNSRKDFESEKKKDSTRTDGLYRQLNRATRSPPFCKLYLSYLLNPRENEVREHIPVPYDNLFQSIFVFAPRCEF